jgi:hypothetical protein
MPTHLWGKDIAQLGRDIVDGPRKTTPDGIVVVKLYGYWYTADHTNIGTFLREWKDESQERTKVSDDDVEEKLAKLEESLLDGKISEETYERLRKKYEGS